jgi:hypothetical protein
MTDITPSPQSHNSPPVGGASAWRKTYKVHPAADVFPMLSDEELQKLGEDIKHYGLTDPILLIGDQVVDGRNRLEAIERAGLKPRDFVRVEHLPAVDAAALVISKNLLRRHMTKAQIAEAIVALAKIEADHKPGQAGPVSDDDRVQIFTACGAPTGAYLSKEFIEKAKQKGGRGKRNPIKDRALKINKILPKKDQVSERTIKRSIAKAEGKTPKYVARPLPKPRSGKPVLGLEAARHHYLDCCTDPGVDLDAERDTIIDALREIAGKRSMARQAAVKAETGRVN